MNDPLVKPLLEIRQVAILQNKAMEATRVRITKLSMNT